MHHITKISRMLFSLLLAVLFFVDLAAANSVLPAQTKKQMIMNAGYTSKGPINKGRVQVIEPVKSVNKNLETAKKQLTLCSGNVSKSPVKVDYIRPTAPAKTPEKAPKTPDSFKATVDLGDRYIGGETRSVDFNKETGLLTVTSYNFTTNHGVTTLQYNPKDRSITVYGDRGTRTVYYRDGRIVSYARGNIATKTKGTKKEYNAQKKALKEMVRDTKRLLKEGGVLTVGSKKDIQNALKMIR